MQGLRQVNGGVHAGTDTRKWEFVQGLKQARERGLYAATKTTEPGVYAGTKTRKRGSVCGN